MRALREPFLFKTIRAESAGVVHEGFCTEETRHTLTVDGRRLIKNLHTFTVEGTRFSGALIDRTPADRITL